MKLLKILYIRPTPRLYGEFFEFFRCVENDLQFKVTIITYPIPGAFFPGYKYNTIESFHYEEETAHKFIKKIGKDWDCIIFAEEFNHYVPDVSQHEWYRKLDNFVRTMDDLLKKPVILFVLDETEWIQDSLTHYPGDLSRVIGLINVEFKDKGLPNLPSYYVGPTLDSHYFRYTSTEWVPGDIRGLVFRGHLPGWTKPEYFPRIQIVRELLEVAKANKVSYKIDVGDGKIGGLDPSLVLTWEQFSKYRIFLSLPGNHTWHINRRVLETAMNGKPIVSYDERRALKTFWDREWLYPPEKWFVHEESALLFSTTDELLQIMDKYLDDDAALQKIWAAGYELINRYHMPWHKASEFLQNVRKILDKS